MAVQIIHRLLSDLSGVEADRSVKFGLDGKEYTIDVTGEEEQELRTLMGKYLAAGRRTAKLGNRPERPASTGAWLPGDPSPHPYTAPTAARRAYLDDIRRWAAENGLTVATHGRIPQHIEDLYVNRDALADAAKADSAERAAQLAAVTGRTPTKSTTNGNGNGKTNGHIPAATFTPPEPDEVKPAGVKRAPGKIGAEVTIPAKKTARKATKAAPALAARARRTGR